MASEPYTAQEFRDVAVGLLQRRKGLDQAVATEVALALDVRTKDVQDAVRVVRLVDQVRG